MSSTAAKAQLGQLINSYAAVKPSKAITAKGKALKLKKQFAESVTEVRKQQVQKKLTKAIKRQQKKEDSKKRRQYEREANLFETIKVDVVKKDQTAANLAILKQLDQTEAAAGVKSASGKAMSKHEEGLRIASEIKKKNTIALLANAGRTTITNVKAAASSASSEKSIPDIQLAWKRKLLELRLG